MSKITDAMHRAQQDRHFSMTAPVAVRYAASLVRPAQTNGRSATLEASAGVHQSAVPQPPASVPAARPAGMPKGPAAPESWEQAIALVTKQLEACEQQVAGQHGEQVRLQAKLRAADQLLAEVERERLGLREAQAAASQQADAVEKTRAAWLRQLEALRECQVLSQACRVAEQELAANTTLIAHTTTAQQKMADEMAHYQQRGTTLRQQMDSLRFQLANALAATGTTDATMEGAAS